MRKCTFALLTFVCLLTNLEAYVKPEAISQQDWEILQPYLLPEDHPVKPSLDKIFRERVTTNYQSFGKAGFIYKERFTRKRLIAKHPKLQGVLIKTFLDVHRLDRQDWTYWKHRIDGAIQIQKCIDNHGYNHIMKVPKKWIYPLPADPAPTEQYPITCCLVAEDMHILHDKKNKAMYRKKMDKERIDALYIVLKENKLWDSIFLFNIPFGVDGKIAFIDTEIFNSDKRPVRYSKLTGYMPKNMQSYWKKLTRNH